MPTKTTTIVDSRQCSPLNAALLDPFLSSFFFLTHTVFRLPGRRAEQHHHLVQAGEAKMGILQGA